jgi:hypothetical protein
MNPIRHHRNKVILIGLIVLNLFIQIYVHFKGMDLVTQCSYFSLNVLWIYLVAKWNEVLIRSIDEMMEDGEY